MHSKCRFVMEIHIKTTSRYHLMPVLKDNIKKSYSRYWKGNTSALLQGRGRN